ncbi:hypothetical protein MRY87_01890 [bacterium]|nr:hypothetical protein [bacterium]
MKIDTLRDPIPGYDLVSNQKNRKNKSKLAASIQRESDSSPKHQQHHRNRNGDDDELTEPRNEERETKERGEHLLDVVV